MKNFKTADWEANKLGDTASIEFAKVGKQKSRKGGKMNIKKINTPPQISPRKINPRTSTIKSPKNQSPKKTIASGKPSRISTPAKSLKVKHSIQNPSQDRNTSASPDKSQNKVQYRSPRKRKASPVKSAQSPAKKFKGDQNNKGSPSKLIKNKTNAGEQNGNVDASNTCDTNNKSPSSNKNPQARVSDIVLGSNKILQVKLRRLSLNYIQKMTSKANSPGKTATSVSPTNKLNAGVRSMKTKKSNAKHNGKLKIKIAGLFSNSKKIAGTITLNKPSKFAKKDTKTTENAVKAVPKTKKIKKANGATPKAKTASPKKIPPSESPKQGSGALNGVEKSTTSSSKIAPKSNLTPREVQRNRTKLNNKMFLRMPKKTETLHKKMSEKLKAARFRYINEQLYTINSSEAVKMFKEDPDSFHAYHAGYRQQVDKWPMNPLTNIINRLKKMPDNVIVADFGCGDAELAKSVKQTVHSFDLVAKNSTITACDMAHVPLANNSVDVTVFCLSLMGTNLQDYLLEANRILKVGGTLKIAEVASRFDNVNTFITGVERIGFKNVVNDLSNDIFCFLDFHKSRDIKNKKNLPTMSLHPCVYKKR